MIFGNPCTTGLTVQEASAARDIPPSLTSNGEFRLVFLVGLNPEYNQTKLEEEAYKVHDTKNNTFFVINHMNIK